MRLDRLLTAALAAVVLATAGTATAHAASCKGYAPVRDAIPSPGASAVTVKNIGCGRARPIMSAYMNSRVARDPSLAPKGWKCRVLEPGEDPLLRCHRGSKSIRWIQENI